MESLAAIGLAGNIIQFISFSSALFSKSREIRHSASGSANEIVDLVLIASKIRKFSTDILLNNTTSNQLSSLAKSCGRVAQELLDAISHIEYKHARVSLGKPPTRWQSFREALKLVWKKDQIDELKARLEMFRNHIMLHMISDTRNSQVKLMDLLSQWEQNNIKSGYESTQRIRDLDSRLQDIQASLVHLNDDARWGNLHDYFTKVAAKAQKISQSHTIIASLRYDYMELRHEAIKDAYNKTFSWIYHPREFQANDPRSQVEFVQWLRHGSGTYWITGKPGSGKSTLMKYLYDDDSSVQNLHVWAESMTLVRAQFYFWNPGQQMQKTLEGLLQTLLYHIFQACPDLVPALCAERWTSESQSQGITSSTPWTLAELQISLAIFKTQCPATTKFYFHIDGLDEYYGDCWEVIRTLQDLSTVPNVKLCLSSRPWNEFQDAFGRSNPNMLQLHELTREDIEVFASENLQSFSRYRSLEPKLFEDLIYDIVDRAQGVFLWVRLAVRSLRDGITNEDTIWLLRERLQAIPSDLEEFFEQILASVDIIYRTRMANTFIATLRSEKPLNIIHYYFLEPNDATSEYERPALQWPKSEIYQRVQQTQRRLNGRFKGLLEPATTVDLNSRTTVDFLHRTLRDFLIRGRMRKTLESWAPQDTHVFTSISRALIAESKFIEEKPSPVQLNAAIELALQASKETQSTVDYFAILDQIDLECERLVVSHSGCPVTSFIPRVAISLGQTEYVRYHLAKEGATAHVDQMLKHAITCPLSPTTTFSSSLMNLGSTAADAHFPCYGEAESGNCSPSPDMVQLLLDHGADPTSSIDGTSAVQIFLERMTGLMDSAYEEQVAKVFQAFLDIQSFDIEAKTMLWHDLLGRKGNNSERASRNTLRLFKALFNAGLDPNADVTKDTTLFRSFLHTLVSNHSVRHGNERIHYHELLNEFLRHGADITQVYQDTSRHGWLERISLKLSHWPAMTFDASRVDELETFFKNGLDPNSALRHTTGTIWEHLLGALGCGLRQSPFNKQHQQVVCRSMTLCLRYGANPHVGEIQEIMKWMTGPDCRLNSSDILEAQNVLRQELAHADRNNFSPTSPPAQQSPLRPVTTLSQHHNTAQDAKDSRKSRKRPAASSAKHIQQLKRPRYGFRAR